MAVRIFFVSSAGHDELVFARLRALDVVHRDEERPIDHNTRHLHMTVERLEAAIIVQLLHLNLLV